MSLYPRLPKVSKNTKCCAICKKNKSPKMFFPIPSLGRLHSYCMPCHAKYMHDRYEHLKHQRHKKRD